MVWREEGSHYQNGDLVLSKFDGSLQLLVVTRHTGDYHHRFMAVEYPVGGRRPQEDDLLKADPSRSFSGYWVGPRVGHLDEEQMVNLGAGIPVLSVQFERPLNDLFMMDREAARQLRAIEPQRSAMNA